MGLFRSKKKTVVSSSIFNLAGDTPVDFVKQTILGSVLMTEHPQVGYDLTKGIITSPGFKLKNYIKWCQNTKEGKKFCEYTGHLYTEFQANYETAALESGFVAAMNLPESKGIKLEDVIIDNADYSFWGEKYLAEHYPQYNDENTYNVKMDFVFKTKTITFKVTTVGEENPIANLTYQIPDYDDKAQYLYAAYQIYDKVAKTVNGVVIYSDPEEIDTEMEFLIYKQGGTNEGFNALFLIPDDKVSPDTFILPPVPFRLKNLQLSQAKKDSNPNEYAFYPLAKRAYYKATGQLSQYKKIDNNILENKKIKEIDYVYLVFGVSINTKNKAGKEYLFHYMMALYLQSKKGSKSMMVYDRGGRARFEHKITWSDMDYGIAKSSNEDEKWALDSFTGSEKYAVTWHDGKVWFLHRKSKSSKECEYVWATDMQHINYVKEGHHTYSSAKDAFKHLTDPEKKTPYEESAFIFPIHEGIYKQMSALGKAQMSQSFAYLLFNCYETKYVKWYKTGAFKVLVTVVLVIAAVVYTYFTGDFEDSASFLGKVTEMLGAAGIGGATGMVIASIIQVASNIIIGAIIAKGAIAGLKAMGFNNFIANLAGTVLAIIATTGINSYLNPNKALVETTSVVTDEAGNVVSASVSSEITTLTPLESFQQTVYMTLTSPVKLIKFTTKVIDAGTQGYFQDRAEELQDKQKEIAEIQKETAWLKQQTDELTGPLSDFAKQLIQWKKDTSMSPEIFQRVTLLCGQDIARITMEYPRMALQPSLHTY